MEVAPHTHGKEAVVGTLSKVIVTGPFDAGKTEFISTVSDIDVVTTERRITTEDTIGHCWHVGITAALFRSNSLTLSVQGDFQRIVTHGDHELSNSLFDIYFSFGGSRVWSDLASIGAIARMPF